MPNKHKDLPSGSQAWANELDQALETIKQLQEVVRRLTENAGIDFSNPQRGINPVRDIPSNANPVGQKLSSLADVQIYNVADKQVLNWSQKDQRWLPVTLPTPTAGGTVDISEVSYSGLASGYGVVDGERYTYNASGTRGEDPFKHYYVENWATDEMYLGAGNWSTGSGFALVDLSGGDAFHRPFVQFGAFDYLDGTQGYFTVASYQVRINDVPFHVHRVNTASRPPMRTDNDWGGSVFDQDLGIPIWWNGTTWVNALGTAV